MSAPPPTMRVPREESRTLPLERIARTQVEWFRGRYPIPAGMEHEDAVAVAWAAAWKATQTYTPSRGASLATWQTVQARNALLELTRLRRYGATVTRAGHRILVEVAAEVPDPRNDYSAADARMLLQALATRLTPREVTVLRLYYVEGYTDREIASELGCSEVRVNQLRHLTRRGALAAAREALAG